MRDFSPTSSPKDQRIILNVILSPGDIFAYMCGTSSSMTTLLMFSIESFVCISMNTPFSTCRR